MEMMGGDAQPCPAGEPGMAGRSSTAGGGNVVAETAHAILQTFSSFVVAITSRSSPGPGTGPEEVKMS